MHHYRLDRVDQDALIGRLVLQLRSGVFGRKTALAESEKGRLGSNSADGATKRDCSTGLPITVSDTDSGRTLLRRP